MKLSMQGCKRPEPSTTAPPSPPPRSHNAETMAAPTTLHQFTLLPAELRNMIWEASLPEARVFDIYPASSSQKKITPQRGLRFANKYTEPPPALTAVCRESRSLALHHYSPLTLDGTTKYVDLRRDVLLLESCLLGRSLLRTLLFMGQIPLIRDNLRSLAFGTSYGVHTGVWHAVLGWNTQRTNNSMGKFLQRLGAFAVLERLVFVVHQEMHFEVARMPSPKKVGSMAMGGEHHGSGKGARGLMAGAALSRNTTVYQAGSSPPAPRALSAEPASSVPSSPCSASTPMTSSTSPPSSSASSSPSSTTRRSGPLDPAFYLTGSDGTKGCLYRVPWTSEKPWLPHANHIAYYPPMANVDDGTVQAGNTDNNGPNHTGNHYNYNNNYSSAAKESTDARPSHGLFPTEDDWIRFQRVIKRDVEAGIKLGLAERAAKPRPCRKRKQAVVEEEDGNLMQQYLQQQNQILLHHHHHHQQQQQQQQQQSQYEQVPPYKTTATKRARKLAASDEAERRRKLPAIEGANLVWRYSLPSS